MICDRKALLKSNVELEYIDAPFVVRAATGNVPDPGFMVIIGLRISMVFR